MRIVIDMQGAQTESRYRGIGRYTLAFAQAVVRNRGEHEVVLALSGLFPDTIESIRAEFDGLLPQENICVWHAPGQVKSKNSDNDARRETAELIREAFLASLQPDIIHITSLFEGYVDDAVTSIGRFDRTTPVSVSLYDLIPLLNPEQYLLPNPGYATHYERKIAALRQAKLLLAISEYSRGEGLLALDGSPDKIVNVGTAIGEEFQPMEVTSAESAVLFNRIGITRAVVLYTGGTDERKNLPRLIEAWSALPASLRQSHQLLFAGRMLEGNIEEFRRLAHIHGLQKEELLFGGYVSDQELVQLYNLCKLYVFPSWHEGFGLPALEAIACGAVVIGANTSSLPEVIGLDEALFDPFDVRAIANKIAQGIEDEIFRERLRSHGKKQARIFSWGKTAKRAIAAWEDILKRQEKFVQPSGPKKRRLAFVSPLPPERTGIADYSAELLPALAQYYDIEIVTTQNHVNEPWVERQASVRDIAWLKENSKAIDRVVYQVGNSPFHKHMLPLLEQVPGVVVLHDFYLSGLFYWLENHGGVENSFNRALYNSHGYSSLLLHFKNKGSFFWDECVKRYPANFDFLKNAQGVIVHSNFSRILARQWYENDIQKNWAIIPHLRVPATSCFDSQKKQLGFNENDFVVCSFGFIGPSKINHRLLDCWLKSKAGKSKNCHLVFVGENHVGDYGNQLLATIKNSCCAERVHITGFASPSVFQQYLAAADMAVQLRTESRGETSGTVLDCMKYGVPLIVNANGSMAELDAKSVWLLPDAFEDEELIDAIEMLWRNKSQRLKMGVQGRKIIEERHAPSNCARMYRDAIEKFHHAAASGLSGLVSEIANRFHHTTPDNNELLSLGEALASTFPSPRPAKCLYLDISATSSNDLKTGIERVARALTLSLLEAPPVGFRVEPVYLSDAGGRWHYRYARRYTMGLIGCPQDVLDDESVEPQNGDVLVGMDISGVRLVHAEQAGLHESYRALGCMIYFVVYDLLPVRMPHVFPPGADVGHKDWLLSVGKFDGAFCISESVAKDMQSWVIEQENKQLKRRPFDIKWFHLGADIANSAASVGVPDDAGDVLDSISSRISFLMVGTIEPRKGYFQVIQAFNQLWREGVNANLVIVGHEGWQGLPNEMRRDIPKTLEHLQTHPENGNRLFWLKGISDEYLEKVYAASTCLIAASYGEGFGLPLIEAAQHKKPIIARDIPVFREVAGEHAYYFSGLDPEALADAIREWFLLNKKGQAPQSDKMTWLTWKESAQNLLNLTMDSQCKREWLPQQPRRFCGGDPRLGTQVGKRTGSEIESTGETGYLIFGGYISLSAGRYMVEIHGAVGKNGVAGAHMDVAVDQGRQIICEYTFNESFVDGCLAALPITLKSSYTDFEVRVWVSEASDLRISMIDISPLPDESIVPVPNDQVMQEKHQRLIRKAMDEHLILIHNARVQLISTLLPQGDVILDLGGANCPLYKMGYPYHFKKLHLIDLPPDSRCDMYKEVVIDPNSDGGGEVVITYGDMTQLDAFPDSSVDFVWSGQSIEHVPHDAGRRMCEAAYRVLKPGGSFCLDTPNRLITKIHTQEIGGGFIHPEHCIEYEPAQLRKILEDVGFVVEKVLGICAMSATSQSGKFDYADFVLGDQITEKVEQSYIQYFHCLKIL